MKLRRRARPPQAAGLAMAALLLLGLARGARAADFKVEAAIDPQVGIDESATFTITLSGSGFGSPDGPPQFELDNLKVARGPFQSQNFSWVNGQTSNSLTLTWQLVPLKIGPASVHGIKVKLKDQEYSLPDQKVEVLAESPQGRAAPQAGPSGRPRSPLDDLFADPFQDRARPAPPRGEAKLFLRAEITPAQPLVGQQVLYTVYLYTQTDVSAVNPRVMPTFRGFWARDIPQPQRQLRPDMVDVQGERFARVVLLQKALFPLAAGKTEIEPLRAELVVRLASAGPFGALVSDVRSIDRASNGLTVEARALPSPPANFPGTVGKLKLDAKLEPAAVKAGEAATLTLTLSGQGNLQGVPDPRLPSLDGVRAFPPQKSGGEELQGTTVTGHRTWSFVLVPERAGTWTLPAVEVPFFDLEGQAFKSASSPVLQLNAAAAAAAPAATTAPLAGSSGPATVPPDSALSPWAAAAAGALGGAMLVGGAVWLIARTQRRKRSGAALQRLRKGLDLAQREDRPRQAADLIEQAWRDFLAERWALPASVPSDRWADELAGRQIAPGLRDDLRRLAEDLNYLRNAPQLSSTETMQAELRELSRRLARAVG